MRCKNYADMFLTLSDENRVRIIQLLSKEEMCGCELLKELEITQSTLSFHMKKLVAGNLITQRRDKKNIYYKINSETINKIRLFVDSIGSEEIPCKESEKNE